MEGWRKINGIARTKVDERKISMATKSKVSKIRESEKKRRRRERERESFRVNCRKKEMEKESRSEAPGHFGERDRRLTMSLDTHYVASWDSTSHYYHPYQRI